MPFSISDIFGSGATVANGSLNIPVANLTANSVGLASGNTSDGEKVFVALLKLASLTLTNDKRDGTNNQTQVSDQNVAIALDDFKNFVTRTINGTSTTFVRRSYTVELDKLDSDANVIDPDDY